MKKRQLKIINFLHLSDKKYNQIRDYRNQEYIRKVSLSDKIITPEEHQEYKKLLEKQDIYFAYLITCDNKDYGVITFKKINSHTCAVGEYLVKEEYKFEGGGVANRYCMLFLCNKLNIKFLEYEVKIKNNRGFKAGNIARVKESQFKNGYLRETVEILDFNSREILNSKPRKLFDKVYEIKECLL